MGQDLPHVNIKGHGRLKGSIIESIKLVFFIIFTFSFLFTLLFQPHVPFIYYLYGMRGHSSWPTEPRTTQGAPALTGSLLGGGLLVSHW
jgi:hypothetical protein